MSRSVPVVLVWQAVPGNTNANPELANDVPVRLDARRDESD
jgi:hypothetical protein